MCVSQVFVGFCRNQVIQYLKKENQSVARNDVTDEYKSHSNIVFMNVQQKRVLKPA